VTFLPIQFRPGSPPDGQPGAFQKVAQPERSKLVPGRGAFASNAPQPRQRAGAPPLALNPFAAAIRRIRAKWAFERAMTEFDRRIAEARRAHKPTRHIEAERRAFTHAALKAQVGR
jgi:hypothetical protein